MGFNAANLSRTTPYNVTGPATYQYFTLTDNVAAVSNAGYFRPFGGANNQGLIPFQFNVGDNIQCTCTNGSVLLNVTDINPLTTSPETITVVVGPDSVNTAAIQDDAVTTAKIDDEAVTTAKIDDLGVTAAKLAADSVITAKILDLNVTSGKLAADSVITTKILNANVTLAKLAAGITPSHIIKAAGRPTTVGGAALETFAVAGSLTTDQVFAQVYDNGTNNVTILQAWISVNGTLSVTFSADPGNDAIFAYQVIRAAA